MNKAYLIKFGNWSAVVLFKNWKIRIYYTIKY